MILPPEIITLCTNEVKDKHALFNLRLVCKDFERLTTPIAFRNIHFSAASFTSDAVSGLQNNTKIANGVRELVWDGQDAQMAEQQLSVEAFKKLSGFKNLSTLRIRFHDIYWQYHDFDVPKIYYVLQEALLEVLFSNPKSPTLETLELSGLVAIPFQLYQSLSSSIADFMRDLKVLHISVISDDNDGAYCEDFYLEFWEESTISLISSATSVESLTIKSDQWVSVYYSNANHWLRKTFPKLSKLTLQNMLFTILPDSLEDFILRQKNSLRDLTLDSCAVYNDVGEANPKLWFAIWQQMQESLLHLTVVDVITSNPASPPHQTHIEGYMELQYVYLDFGYSYMETMLDVNGFTIARKTEDNNAFSDFLNVVDARKLKPDFDT